MSAQEGPSYRYGAFISYRHVEPDRAWARWLHTALETYRTPRALVREMGLPERVGRVFRDEEEIPAAPSLTAAIETALQQSRYLIVICSPRTPASEWVDREIARFRELGRGDRILALIIEGEPRASFPRSLSEIRRPLVDATGLEVEREMQVEPLAADVRPRSGEPVLQQKRSARLSLISIILGCRFDDLRRRDGERRTRRLRRVVVGLALLVLIFAGLAGLALVARSESDRNALRADRERDEVLRLADVKIVRDLVSQASRLWPIHPDEVPAMADWLEQARETVASRSRHAASLARLQEYPESFGTERTTAWRLQVLSDLLAGLDSIQDARDDTKGLRATIEARREYAARLREWSIDDHAEEWRRTVAGVAASSRYGGLRIKPQLGLVPLGADAESGLYEFAHIGSGSIPERDPATKRLILKDDAAIVVVLIPGGTFKMGAQSEDPELPNYDPQAKADESPVHEVTLSAFLLGKHECTQAQWRVMTEGEEPSTYRAGHRLGDRAITGRNPVEQVSRDDCESWLWRNRLLLPTEAQWEYACRAGTTTPWVMGRDVAALGSVANIADKYCKAQGGFQTWAFAEEVDDGHAVHAPVGAYRANAFGLFDMHGNVYEWCRDAYGAYSSTHESDPFRDAPGDRLARGGGWFYPPEYARSASRNRLNPAYRRHSLGVRAAMALDTT